MRSISFTILLAAIAVAICGFLGWQAREGNLSAVFGAPPVPPGQRLYSGFQPAEVGRIVVSAHDIEADFVKTSGGWMAAAPPKDRMDPRSAIAIIAFTLNLKVADFAPVDDVNRDKSGLRDESIQIRLETASGSELARYRLGARTPLLSPGKDGAAPDPTVFIQRRERGHKDYVYACTGDIRPLFKDNFKFLRDHQPFYFNPLALQKIRLRGPGTDLTLSHDEPKAGWRIVRPLDLATNKSAVINSLIEGMVKLRALKVADRSTVPLPGPEAAAKAMQIGITEFGSDKETLLEIFPPENPAATEALAVVGDRPNTVFSLPLKSEPGFESLADLPMTVNELRDPVLVNLDISVLRAILIRPATGKEILVTCEPKESWEVEIDGKVGKANELRVFDLLNAITTRRVLGFESDAATNLAPWGLDKPFLMIGLLGENNQAITLNFGSDGHGGIFVNRKGTLSVMRVDEEIFRADSGRPAMISIQPYEWRDSLLWSISTVDLVAIQRVVGQETPLDLGYDDNEEKWNATVNGTDVTPSLDPEKASRLLRALLDLNVTRWLDPADPKATAALATPSFTLNVTEEKIDAFGEKNGIEGREITIAAPPGETSPRFYFGRLTDEPNPFLIDRDTFLKISIDPMEKP